MSSVNRVNKMTNSEKSVNQTYSAVSMKDVSDGLKQDNQSSPEPLNISVVLICLFIMSLLAGLTLLTIYLRKRRVKLERLSKNSRRASAVSAHDAICRSRYSMDLSV